MPNFVQVNTNLSTYTTCDEWLQVDSPSLYGVTRPIKLGITVLKHLSKLWRTAQWLKKQLLAVNNVQQSPKYVEWAGSHSYWGITHRNPHTCTSLILSSQFMKKPHPTLLQPLHSPDQLHSPHQQLTDTQREKKLNKDEKKGGRNLKSIQEKWAVNIMAFSSGEGSSNQWRGRWARRATGTSGTVSRVLSCSTQKKTKKCFTGHWG